MVFLKIMTEFPLATIWNYKYIIDITSLMLEFTFSLIKMLVLTLIIGCVKINKGNLI